MSFEIVVDQTLEHEGVWSKDPNDTGGETAFGKSRKNFPNGPEWAIIDRYKKMFGEGTKAFIRALENDNELQRLIRKWYKDTFWNPFDLDKVNDYGLAYEVFDQAVNMGVSRTTQFIQMSCNALNYKYAFGADLNIDGRIGPLTRLRFVSIANNTKYSEVLRRALDGLQVWHYINLGLSKSSKSDYRKYTRGWLLNRVGKYNEQGLVA